MHEVLVNRLGGLSLPRKSVVRLTDRPDMTVDVYRGRKTTMQQQQKIDSGLIHGVSACPLACSCPAVITITGSPRPDRFITMKVAIAL